MKLQSINTKVLTTRAHFFSGSDARIIMSGDEAA